MPGDFFSSYFRDGPKRASIPGTAAFVATAAGGFVGTDGLGFTLGEGKARIRQKIHP